MAGDNQAITGQLAQAAGEILPLKVCQSRAGFYMPNTGQSVHKLKTLCSPVNGRNG
jgi:hypothetical protein